MGVRCMGALADCAGLAIRRRKMVGLGLSCIVEHASRYACVCPRESRHVRIACIRVRACEAQRALLRNPHIALV